MNRGLQCGRFRTHRSSQRVRDDATSQIAVIAIQLAAAVLLICGNAVAEQPALPHKISLLAEFELFGLTPLAQGNRDVCSLFAITAVAEFERDRHAKNPQPRLSEEYLIWAAKEAVGKSGDQAMFYEAVLGLDHLGICPSELMPYTKEPGHHAKPSQRRLSRVGNSDIAGVPCGSRRWSVDAKLTEPEHLEIKRALAAGHPVACGLRWPNKLQGSELLKVPPPQAVFDGHSIVLVGFEDDPKQPGGGAFQFRNSDGPNWGERGYGLISYGYVRAFTPTTHYGCTSALRNPKFQHVASRPNRCQSCPKPRSMGILKACKTSSPVCGAGSGTSSAARSHSVFPRETGDAYL